MMVRRRFLARVVVGLLMGFPAAAAAAATRGHARELVRMVLVVVGRVRLADDVAAARLRLHRGHAGAVARRQEGRVAEVDWTLHTRGR